MRAAWIVASTSSEFGPHHTSRSPGRAPAASRPCASWFTSALSSAKVVVEAVRAADSRRRRPRSWSGARSAAWTAEGVERSVHRIGACSAAPDQCRTLVPMGRVRRARHRRRVLRHAVVARRPPRRDLVPRAARAERVRVRAQGRRQAPGRLAGSVRRRASSTGSASSPRTAPRTARGSGSRSRPASTSTTSRTPTAPRCCAKLAAAARRGRAVVPAPARRHPDATRARAASGRARDLAVRHCAPLARRRAHDVPDRVRRHRTRRRISRELGAGLPRRGRRDVDRAHRVLARRCAPPTPGAGPRRWVAGATIVWDNTPVNDALMTALAAPRSVPGSRRGPRRGRRRRAVQPDDPGARIAGRSSRPRWSSSPIPTRYDAAASWARAIADGRRRAGRCARGAGAGPAPTARSPSRTPSSWRAWSTTLEASVDGPGLGRGGRGDPRPSCGPPAPLAEAFPDPAGPDDPLGAEVAPWAAAGPAAGLPAWPRCA